MASKEVTTLAGHGLLAAPSEENVKKWLFRSNVKHTAVVVYDFRFPPAESQCESPDDQQQFVLEPPNFAVVTAAGVYLQSSQK